MLYQWAFFNRCLALHGRNAFRGLMLRVFVSIVTASLAIVLPCKMASASNYAFVNVAADAGVDVRMTPNAYPRAVAIADYDADGHQEFFLAVSGRDPNGHPGSPHVGAPSYLFRNCGNGFFEDVTLAAGLYRSNRSSSGAAFADFDNDGDLDLYIANRGAVNAPASINELFRNNGDGSFTEIAEAAGVANRGFSYSIFWLDVEHDGDLDLFVENLAMFGGNEGNTIPDALYRNNGDGAFEEVTKDFGLLPSAASGGDGGAVGDFDDDGLQDILKIAADISRFFLLRNEGGQGFVDETTTSGLGSVPPSSGLSMSRGLAFGDYDNDGDLDLFVVGVGLFRNNGDSPRTFTNVTDHMGFDFEPYEGRRFGHTWADVNNDGWLDIVAENRFARLAIFLNLEGTGRFQVFEDIEPVLDMAGDPKVGLGVLDFDGDGDLDIFLAREGDTMNGGQPQVLYENRMNTGHHHLKVTLVGTGSSTPRDANGTRITVEAGLLRQMREVQAGENASGAADLRQHFGLGLNTMVDRLTVRWPSGEETIIEAVPADQHIRIVEGSTRWTTVTPAGIPDYAADGHVNAGDYLEFTGCFSGPDVRLTSCPCVAGDFDENRRVDLLDAAAFQNAFTGD